MVQHIRQTFLLESDKTDELDVVNNVAKKNLKSSSRMTEKIYHVGSPKPNVLDRISEWRKIDM